MRTRFLSVVIAVVLICAVIPGAVAADHDEDEDDDDDDDNRPIVNIDIDIEEIVDAIKELLGSFTDFTEGRSLAEILAETIFQVLFNPFYQLINAVLGFLMATIAYYPQIHPAPPAVKEVHELALSAAALLSMVVLAGTGLALTGSAVIPDRFTLSLIRAGPAVIAALVFGIVSLPVLGLAVEVSRELTLIFLPRDPSFLSSSVVAGELVLVAVVNAVFTLVVILLYWVKGAFVLYAAAISPLVAIAYVTPFAYPRKVAKLVVAGFWGSLFLGPMAALLLRLHTSLIGTGRVSDWVAATGLFFLLLVLPKLTWDAGSAVAMAGYIVGGGARRSVSRHIRRKRWEEQNEDWEDREEFLENLADGHNRRNNDGEARYKDPDYYTDGGSDDTEGGRR